ncbi:D-2-hydroxyacid dehydrogenase family protein [Chelatococcus sp. GCM10030263]|uniref:D-2-hydroxyacid dehydrogenase family protein n=1 Tax=Chelatococcus sp. GCM10030263 TaxID=3273387 RepID=UPI0036125C78
MPQRCAILDDYQDVALAMADWGGLAGAVEVDRFADHVEGQEVLAARLADYDILLAMRERTAFGRDLLARLPKLKLLLTTGMLNAAIDMQAAAELGITVAGTRGTVGPAAELTWGLLLALTRHIPAEVANFRAGGERWQISVGSGLKGKTLGVAGIGKLGQLVAGYGRAFGMNVLGWSRSNTPERSAALGIGFAASLDELLAVSDIVTLHLTLTPETAGIIGRREIGLMKAGAIIVNTSRGPLIDEPALIEALENGRIGGAALDVFDREPLPADHPFRRLANVVATPHLGYVTEETYRVYFADAVEDITAWLAGSPLRVLNGVDAARARR